jgi:hypothetical protein
MAKGRRQEPRWGIERQGPSFGKGPRHELEAPGPEPEDRERCQTAQKLLRTYGRDARANEGRKGPSDPEGLVS